MRQVARHLVTLLLAAIMVTGLGLILYPSMSDWWNSMHMTHVVNVYVDMVADMDEETIEKLRREAAEYNKHLADLPGRWELSDEELAYYGQVLDVDGSGTMGYLLIPKIGTQLPVYHGTNENVLQTALGHLEGSSMPVGGPGTHAVVSGHRGLPGARLLTDLDRMAVGDTFSLTVLDRTMTYRVDQIVVVLPDELEELDIDPEEDYVTLVTCTPYGVNSHRLLVRGRRTRSHLRNEALMVPPHQTLPVAAILLALLLIIGRLILPRRRVRLRRMAGVREAWKEL